MKVKDNKKGFTIIEGLIVMAVMMLIVAMSIPSFIEWYQNARYRGGARDVASELRLARQLAVSRNEELNVVLEDANGRLQVQTSGGAVVRDWLTLPTGVNMSNDFGGTVQFNPNGTSSAAGTISIQDSGGTTRYTIAVTSTTGRIRITKL